MKRTADILLSLAGLLFFSPLFFAAMLAVWAQDFRSPFYMAPRVGRNEKIFRMVKLRSMVVGADRTGVDSTSSGDLRITPVGKLVRKYKLDELTQLWNVFKGEMSLVGPRPNVKRETDLYTSVEKKLLTVKPGITDISSIVFSDEGEILKDKPDPDLAYNQLIRPWKSRLGLLYVEKRSFVLDLKLVFLTALAVFSRKRALEGVSRLLKQMGTDDRLIQIAKRKMPLFPFPPPGAEQVVTSRR